MFKHSNPIRKVRGFTLIEALISLAVLSFGLLAVGSFQSQLVKEGAYNKARSEALTLAQQKIDDIRSYSSEQGLVGKLLNNMVPNPAVGSEYEYPDDITPGVTHTYGPETITGTNATYEREWMVSRAVTSDTTDDDSLISNVIVEVSWTDRSGDHTVSLETDVTWRNPKGSADVAEFSEPLVESPTGKAYLGDGSLTAQEMTDLRNNNPDKNNNDGTWTHDHDGDGDLELVVENDDGSAEVVLTLPDACQTDTGICTDFVKISGTVYFHRNDDGYTSKVAASKLVNDGVWVIASDAAYCSRWVPLGTTHTAPDGNPRIDTSNDLSTLPNTGGNIWTDASDAVVDFTGAGYGNYEYFNYTCYLGGGWYGNIGLVLLKSTNQDYACVGVPTASATVPGDKWRRVELAKRRVYRGMLHKYEVDESTGNHIEITDDDGATIFYSRGIKDAAVLPDSNWAERNYGHDYVVSNTNSPTADDCKIAMSMPDADPDADTSTANLFHHVTGDFVCLNQDGDNSPGVYDGEDFSKFLGYPWNYLNTFDHSIYDARVDCPYDPSVPPAKRYTFSGTISFPDWENIDTSWGSTDPADGLFDGNINTSDGYGNCTITSNTNSSVGYFCEYYVWTEIDGVTEYPWSGAVTVNAPVDVACAPNTADLSDPTQYSSEAVYDGDLSGSYGVLKDASGTDITSSVNFTCEDLSFTVSGEVTVDAGNDLTAAGFSDTSLVAYDNTGTPIANSCEWTVKGSDKYSYTCNVAEETYTAGFTGMIELAIPAGYTCDTVTSTDASSTFCGTNGEGNNVVQWNFTTLTSDSIGNNILFDGPNDQFTFEGSINNSEFPDPWTYMDFGVSTDPSVANCVMQPGGTNKTATYQCTLTIPDDTTWTGNVVINPPQGWWCDATQRVGTASVTIPGGTPADISCMYSPAGVVSVKVIMYAFTFSSTQWLKISMIGDDGSVDGTCTYPATEYPLAQAQNTFTCTTPVLPDGSLWSGHITVEAVNPTYDPTYGSTVCPVTGFNHPIYYVGKESSSTHYALIGLDYLCSWSVYTDPTNHMPYWPGWDGTTTAEQ